MFSDSRHQCCRRFRGGWISGGVSVDRYSDSLGELLSLGIAGGLKFFEPGNALLDARGSKFDSSCELMCCATHLHVSAMSSRSCAKQLSLMQALLHLVAAADSNRLPFRTANIAASLSFSLGVATDLILPPLTNSALLTDDLCTAEVGFNVDVALHGHRGHTGCFG